MMIESIKCNFCFVDKNRSILTLEGKDKVDFLQALTTNNIENIPSETIVYTAILSPQGKYLFDFFVFSLGDNKIFIDINKSRAGAIKKFLEFYKLNSDVTISDRSCQIVISSIKEGRYSFADPRANILGWRCYDFKEELKIQDQGLDDFQINRLKNLVPETGVELIPEKSYILELNFEKLQGVDFKKGCYIGQEVTARMKHKATLKNRLFCGYIRNSPQNTDDRKVYSNDKVVGDLYSIFNNYCLIKIKEDFKDAELTVFGEPLTLLN
ncbi:folate-binding protein [Paracoccaceae bacterium]|nr:folate-binding protein [Paracoccaceae bacterium]